MYRLFDFFFLPVLLVLSLPMWLYRRIGSRRLPLNTKALRGIGVFPIINHYYEPAFGVSERQSDVARRLPGLDLNVAAQLSLLRELNSTDEFASWCAKQSLLTSDGAFAIRNGSFEVGDADILFGMIRKFKPRKVIEVGAGSSTRIIAEALRSNRRSGGHEASHTCIEPYEQPWLENFEEINLVRSRLEDLRNEIFSSLGRNDLLFIDSSHIIRPGGISCHCSWRSSHA